MGLALNSTELNFTLDVLGGSVQDAGAPSCWFVVTPRDSATTKIIRVANFQGFKSSLISDLPSGSDGTVSPWIHQGLADALNFENDSVHLHTLGPSIPPDTRMLDAARAQLVQAASLPEFVGDAALLRSISRVGAPRSLTDALGQMASSRTGFLRDFLIAMVFDLESSPQ